MIPSLAPSSVRDIWFEGLNDEELSTQFPLQQIHGEGLPAPGLDFLQEAMNLGDPPWKIKYPRRKKGEPPPEPPQRLALESLYRAALYRVGFHLTVADGPVSYNVQFVPGHVWGASEVGPLPARVMLVGQNPGRQELEEMANFVGEYSQPLHQVLRELGIPEEEYTKWYLTNLVRFPPPAAGSKLPVGWIKDCLPLLYQELRMVRPQYLLLLGDKATKAFLGSRAKVGELVGQLQTIEVPLDDGTVHTVQTMVSIHPAAVSHEPEKITVLRDGLRLFQRLITTGQLTTPETLERHYIYTREQLAVLLQQVLQETREECFLALDVETHCQAWEPTGYVRTVQFSYKPNFGAALVVRLQGGAENPDLNEADVREALLLLTERSPGRNVRIIGHNFKYDLPWLKRLGVDLHEAFMPPEDEDTICPNQDRIRLGWEKTRIMGGFDTMIAANCVDETGPLKLEVLGTTLLGRPRYDQAIHDHIAAMLQEKKLKREDLEGYGDIPDFLPEVSSGLLPYGTDDVDTCIRLFYLYNGRNGVPGLLDHDRFGNSNREAFYLMQTEAPILAEMEATGLPLNRQRAEALTHLYADEVTLRLEKLRQKMGWPDFNINSFFHKRSYLFGEELTGKWDRKTGHNSRVAPDGAISLHLTPITTTKKHLNKPWEAGYSRNRTPESPDPSTDKTTLGILALTQKHGEVNDLKDIIALNHVPKNVLRRPGTVVNADGETEDSFDEGLIAFADSAGRVHTSFLYAETGRLRSFKPNLQNQVSESREEYYERLLGERYLCPIRSLFEAPPGYLLIEADYIGAEVGMAAIMSNDQLLLEHYRRNILPESHPDHYDIHSNTAAMAFRLDCVPSKKGLAAIGRKGLRTAAKHALFGSFYQQGAQGAALKANEEGADISLEQMEALQLFLYKRYPQLYGVFMPLCMERAIKPGYLRTWSGRLRRFPETKDEERQQAFGREATNFPIQGGVADVVRYAMKNIDQYRKQHSFDYTFLLTVHDSIMGCVPVDQAEFFVDQVIPSCMVEQIPIVPTDLDGKPRRDGPYYLGVDTKVYLRWGESISVAEATKHGVPMRFAK